jgi:hypothetical protein
LRAYLEFDACASNLRARNPNSMLFCRPGTLTNQRVTINARNPVLHALRQHQVGR